MNPPSQPTVPTVPTIPTVPTVPSLSSTYIIVQFHTPIQSKKSKQSTTGTAIGLIQDNHPAVLILKEINIKVITTTPTRPDDPDDPTPTRQTKPTPAHQTPPKTKELKKMLDAVFFDYQGIQPLPDEKTAHPIRLSNQKHIHVISGGYDPQNVLLNALNQFYHNNRKTFDLYYKQLQTLLKRHTSNKFIDKFIQPSINKLVKGFVLDLEDSYSTDSDHD